MMVECKTAMPFIQKNKKNLKKNKNYYASCLDKDVEDCIIPYTKVCTPHSAPPLSTFIVAYACEAGSKASYTHLDFRMTECPIFVAC